VREVQGFPATRSNRRRGNFSEVEKNSGLQEPNRASEFPVSFIETQAGPKSSEGILILIWSSREKPVIQEGRISLTRADIKPTKRATFRRPFPGQRAKHPAGGPEVVPFSHAYTLSPPILDRLGSLDYTRRFNSVPLTRLKGRVLCRNARFNRKCAVATKHTDSARA
jgi:hypothetical protein